MTCGHPGCAIEGASAVADGLAGRPEFEHVEFMFPDDGDGEHAKSK